MRRLRRLPTAQQLRDHLIGWCPYPCSLISERLPIHEKVGCRPPLGNKSLVVIFASHNTWPKNNGLRLALLRSLFLSALLPRNEPSHMGQALHASD